MSKLFKVLLIWLCAVAFPLQGMAGVAMIACGANHAHAQAVPTEDMHEGHEGHDDMAHAHVQASPTAGHQHGSGQSAGKCSACASCCIGVGLAATLPAWQIESPGPSALVGSAKVLLPSFMADALERPPRHVLA